MPDLLRDLRWAVRSLGRTPLFAAVAVLTLALGIGVNATIFTLVNSILLRPLPVERPDELVHVYTSWTEEPFGTSSYADYLDLRDGVAAFAGGPSSGLLGHASAIATLQHGGQSEVLIGEIVTGNAFAVLGVGAERGRMLLPEDDRLEAPRVVVLGQGLWQRRFGGDPGVLGQAVRFNGQEYQVVGIAPASFHGLLPGVAADYWVPAVRTGDVEPAGRSTPSTATPGPPASSGAATAGSGSRGVSPRGRAAGSGLLGRPGRRRTGRRSERRRRRLKRRPRSLPSWPAWPPSTR
jgi:hypothetical protein